MAYQSNIDVESLQPSETKNSRRWIIGTVAVAAVFILLAGVSVQSSQPTKTVSNLAATKPADSTPKVTKTVESTPKVAKVVVLTPEQEAAKAEAEALAAKNAEALRIKQLPTNYVPALDYRDPCDALRDECCTDTSFPILGGLDLVHFRLTGQLAFGNSKMSSDVVGISRTYKAWFSQKSYQTLFEANPDTYLPLFGGFNAEEFCASQGSLDDLIATTVELSLATEVDRKLAFNEGIDAASCIDHFNSFYGNPVNGIFNTRCVSMKGVHTLIGLEETMPESAVPVRMSALYGIPVTTSLKKTVATPAAVAGSSVSFGAPAMNQFGAPANQFGAVAAPFGTQQFGQPQTFGAAPFGSQQVGQAPTLGAAGFGNPFGAAPVNQFGFAPAQQFGSSPAAGQVFGAQPAFQPQAIEAQAMGSKVVKERPVDAFGNPIVKEHPVDALGNPIVPKPHTVTAPLQSEYGGF
jgi:hypothetical protein